MDDATPTKWCGGCQQTVPRSEFRPRKGTKDGLQSRCKSCESEYQRRYYEANREKRSKQAAEWYAANRERKRATQEAWRLANPEWHAEYRRIRAERDPDERRRLTRKWRAENPERARELNRRWREANRERQRELYRAAYAANPLKFIEAAHKRRAQIAQVTVGEINYEELWTGDCGICGDPIDRALAYPDPLSKSVDHIIPLARGGGHTQDNLQWAHLRCNISKGARLLDTNEGVA